VIRDPQFLEYGEALGAPAEEVGGKARNLARAHQAGLEVPDGVILPRSVAAALDGAAQQDRLFTSLAARFAGADMLVVRSSAPGEDAAEHSWAGQFASIICRSEPSAITDACHRCWSSLGSAAAAAYGGAAGESAGQGMALLVQSLVPATAAGVCFTPEGDPRGGEYLVNAVHGLGSVVTDDEAVADHCRVDLATGRVARGAEGRQRQWRPPASPWSLVGLPRELAGRPTLDDDQARRVAALAGKAADLLGCRADVEWALAGKRLFLLQARPVTTGTAPQAGTRWTRDNAADVIPGVVTPLTWSLLGPEVNRGFREVLDRLRPGGPKDRLFTLIDCRAYFNMSAYNRLAGGGLSAAGLLVLGFGWLRLLLRHRLEAGRGERCFPVRLAAARSTRPGEALDALQRLLGRYMTVHVRTTVLMDLGLTLLRAVLGKRTGEAEAAELVHHLMAGAGPLVSCAPAEALEQLAEAVGRDEGLRRRVAESEPAEAARLLAGAGAEVSGRWANFLQEHGHSALEEFELLHPRWHEAPDFPVRMLQSRLERAASPAARGGAGSETGGGIDAGARLGELLPALARPPAALLVRHLRRCAVLRESYKQLLVRIVDAARTVVLQAAETAALSPPELVFFLTVAEAGGVDGPEEAATQREIARERQREWQRVGEQAPWAEIHEYPDGRQVRIPRPAGRGPVLRGMAQSGGRYAGTARVVLDPGRVHCFQPGDVLVAQATNPAWTPLIALAGAVATDMGNYLSHGAIIARELGIPAVGNLYDATSRIDDGQSVEVDGDRGLVRLLRDDP